MKFALICCLLGFALGGGVVFVVTMPKKNPELPAPAEQPKINHTEEFRNKLIGIWVGTQVLKDGSSGRIFNKYYRDGRMILGTARFQLDCYYTLGNTSENQATISYRGKPDSKDGEPNKLEYSNERLPDGSIMETLVRHNVDGTVIRFIKLLPNVDLQRELE